MTEPDPHSPTSAGPEPTPVVGPAEATWSQPAGTARPVGPEAAAEKPEVLVGAAFAGGLVAARLLKALANRRHR